MQPRCFRLPRQEDPAYSLWGRRQRFSQCVYRTNEDGTMGTMATEPAGKRLEETQYLCTLIKKLPSSCLAESAHHSAWMVLGSPRRDSQITTRACAEQTARPIHWSVSMTTAQRKCQRENNSASKQWSRCGLLGPLEGMVVRSLEASVDAPPSSVIHDNLWKRVMRVAEGASFVDTAALDVGESGPLANRWMTGGTRSTRCGE